MTRVAVAGATGAVGTRLVDRLTSDGVQVVALSRSGTPDPRPNVQTIAVDVADTAATASALTGCEVAYYLVHSMGHGEDFVERDATRARAFGDAAASAGVKRVVYLGGLGAGELSSHLASRQQVGSILAERVPTVELRAAVVLGAGSISFEMVRYLAERLPFMITPRWVRTPMQPIGMRDLLDILVRAASEEPGVIEIGIRESVTYSDLLNAYARVRGLKRRFIIPVPLLSLSLSSYWVDLVTPVDRKVSHSLIGSLGIPVTVSGPRQIVVDRNVDELIAEVLNDQAEALDRGPAQASDVPDGVSVMVSVRELNPQAADEAKVDLDRIGGDLGWYGVKLGWRLRIALGRILGEDLQLHKPDQISVGAEPDWWTVVDHSPGDLTLRSRGWRVGEAWLRFSVLEAPGAARIRCVGAFRPRGVLGLAYWTLLRPVHLLAFRAMAARRVKRAA